MKIAVLGGGGVRSIFLARSLAAHASDYGIDDLVFMDNDPLKLRVYGRLAKEAAERIDPAVSLTLTEDASQAIENADYVITTLRVGGDQTRVEDESLPLSLGLLAQETTGPCGFSFAMRSAPALLDYCARIRHLAKPDVKVFNFTNPAGLVSQILRDAGYDFTYGICDAPSSLLAQIARNSGFTLPGQSLSPLPDAEGLEMRAWGLNHLSFFRLTEEDGTDRTPAFLENDGLYHCSDMRLFDKALACRYGFLFNEYLYYYFYREIAVHNILQAKETRAAFIAHVNEKMTAELLDLEKESFERRLEVFCHWYGRREEAYMATESGQKRGNTWKFDLYEKKLDGYAGVALNYMRIIQSGKPARMIMSVPNQGALPFLAADDVAEVSCLVSPTGLTPDPAPPLPEVAKQLIVQIKAYEREAAAAILQHDVQKAADALQMNPFVASYSLGKQLAEHFFRHNDAWTRP